MGIGHGYKLMHEISKITFYISSGKVNGVAINTAPTQRPVKCAGKKGNDAVADLCGWRLKCYLPRLQYYHMKVKQHEARLREADRLLIQMAGSSGQQEINSLYTCTSRQL